MSTEKTESELRQLANDLWQSDKYRTGDAPIIFQNGVIECYRALFIPKPERSPEEVFAKHWKLRTGKELDETTKAHMSYCFDAMNEFASQSKVPQSKMPDEQIEKLAGKDLNERKNKGHYELSDLKSDDYYCDGFFNGYSKAMNKYINHPQEEVEKLKKMLQETAMRANVCFPKSEEDIIHFEEKFSGSKDFLIRLFDILGLGKMPSDHFENIVAEEAMEPVIENAVYGMCPKCNENMVRCSCNMPTIDEILKRGKEKEKIPTFRIINEQGEWIVGEELINIIQATFGCNKDRTINKHQAIDVLGDSRVRTYTIKVERKFTKKELDEMPDSEGI